MERPKEEAERPTEEPEVIRLLGALGLYDASQDTYDNPDHDDEQWIMRGND